jgi:hypothetical protein
MAQQWTLVEPWGWQTKSDVAATPGCLAGTVDRVTTDDATHTRKCAQPALNEDTYHDGDALSTPSTCSRAVRDHDARRLEMRLARLSISALGAGKRGFWTSHR